jgi:DNA-binding NarL/FixJ family response regulator
MLRPSEKRVLVSLCKTGCFYKAAEATGLKASTVKEYAKLLYRVHGVHSLSELIAYAFNEGLVKPIKEDKCQNN